MNKKEVIFTLKSHCWKKITFFDVYIPESCDRRPERINCSCVNVIYYSHCENALEFDKLINELMATNVMSAEHCMQSSLFLRCQAFYGSIFDVTTKWWTKWWLSWRTYAQAAMLLLYFSIAFAIATNWKLRKLVWLLCSNNVKVYALKCAIVDKLIHTSFF